MRSRTPAPIRLVLKRAVSALLLCFHLVNVARAAGTTAAPFLQMGSGARAAALGDSFVSRANDVSATYWNPAGLSQLGSKELLFDHTFHVQDISVSRVAYGNPVRAPRSGMGAVWAVSAAYLSLDGIESRTGNTAQPDGSFGASDFYGALSFSQPLSRSMSLGLTAKVLRSELGSHRSNGYAADFGLLQRVGRVQMGIALTNVGPSMKYINDSAPLPQTLRGGLSMNVHPNWPLSVSVEGEKERGESVATFRTGVEMDFQSVALRMGYGANSASRRLVNDGSSNVIGRFNGLTGGLGLNFSRYSLDYAFTPYGDLGEAHRMSLKARF